MRKNPQIPAICVAFVAISCITPFPGAAPTSPEREAKRILDATGIRGGLIVHLGCGDGRLTASLFANESYLVHGLDTDAENVQKARKHIRSLGPYGKVSVDRFRGKQLPYAENLVNLFISENPGEIGLDEVMRVLVPNGVTYIKAGGKWSKTIKPWPDEIDEWTHFLHDASNNAVADDTRLGPPRRLKWACGPLWSRSHEFTSSLCAMVSAQGRLFYILDEGLTGVTTRSIPEKWTLVARDAFNGLLLWKRAVPKWGSGRWGSRALRRIPATVPRRLVAEGDRVFVTLGYDAPVSLLDAGTGRALTTYEETEGTEEIRCSRGILMLRKGREQVLAIDTKAGERLWKETGKIRPLSLAIHDNKGFYQDGQWLLCRKLESGEELWRAPSKRPVSLLLAHDDRLVLLSGTQLRAIRADTGDDIWVADAGVRRKELFIANQKLWHWEGTRIVGRDLSTGEVARRLATSDVFTPGHHLRCYQSKGTENFLITPNRGVEFVSVTGGAHTQNDWVRGACVYGVMPCNGLLYVPAHPCFCYLGVKLIGFNALAPKADGGNAAWQSTSPARLVRGRAYDQAKELASSVANVQDNWPTYRHDARRTGATNCEVPARVSARWRVPLDGPITPPVVSGSRVYVAAKDTHTLHALKAKSGERLWHFTAGGRIDSPPTVLGKLILFGCADGWVYCLRAADGALVWRFRAAPSDQRVVAFGRLESPWRVHGNILAKDGLLYFTAGRSSYLDGGISIFGLDPKTGRVVHKAQLDTWARTRKDAEGKPFIPGYHMEGARSDILVSQGDSIYLGQVKFDKKLARQKVPYVLADPKKKTVGMELSGQPFIAPDAEPEKDYEHHQRQWLERTQPELLKNLHRAFGSHNLGDRHMGLHVFSTSGFLDDTWFNRTYWMYSATWPGFYLAHRAAKTGQLLVVGPENTYAVQAYPSRNLQSPLLTPGETGYLLFADRNDNEPILDYRTRGTTKGWGFTRQAPPVWHRWVPVRIRAMVLTADYLFVAGPPDVVDLENPMAAFEGRKGGRIMAFSKSHGTEVAEMKLDSPPVFDGMIAAGGHLYMSLEDGSILCMAPVQ